MATMTMAQKIEETARNFDWCEVASRVRRDWTEIKRQLSLKGSPRWATIAGLQGSILGIQEYAIDRGRISTDRKICHMSGWVPSDMFHFTEEAVSSLIRGIIIGS